MQRIPSYETLYKRFIDGVEKTKNIDYLDRHSIKKNNSGVDQYRKAAKQIGELYPDRIEDFAILLDSDDIKLKICCAICLVELMNAPEGQQSLAISEVKQYYRFYANGAEKMMIEVWLEKMAT